MSVGSCYWFQRVQVTHQHNKQGHEQQSMYLFHAGMCALVCFTSRSVANLLFMIVIPSAQTWQSKNDGGKITDANQVKLVVLR